MPSYPVHLKVCTLLCDKLGVSKSNKPDFFLGSAAPDSVNLHGFASAEIRYAAHIRSKDYAIWKKQLKAFYEDNKISFKNNIDYLKGYVFHCVTDIAWDEQVQPLLFEYFNSMGIPYEQQNKLKWKELYRLNSLLVKENWYTNAAKLVSQGVPKDIATVTANQVSEYRDYICSDYKDKLSDEAPLFLTDEHINQCAKAAEKLFKQIVQD